MPASDAPDPPRLRLGVSSCLLGERVRFNGDHKRDRFVTDILGRYVERTGGSSAYRYATVVDMRLDWRRLPWSIVVQLTNLFDRRYAEIPGLQMPGRLVTATTGWSF